MNDTLQIIILFVGLLSLAGVAFGLPFIYVQIKQMQTEQNRVVENNTSMMNTLVQELKSMELQMEHLRETQDVSNRITEIEKAMAQIGKMIDQPLEQLQ